MRTSQAMASFVVTLCLLMPSTLRAGTIANIMSVSSYEEQGGNQDTVLSMPGGTPLGDQFFIDNGSDAGVFISRVVINLATSATPSVFDTAPSAGGTAGRDPASAFTDTQGAMVTGFTGATVTDGSPTLTMNFTDFGRLETFGFQIDVDNMAGNVANDQRFVPAAEFDGATFTVTYLLPGGFEVTRAGTYMAAGELRATGMIMETVHIPEPSTLLLVGFGLVVLAAIERKRLFSEM